MSFLQSKTDAQLIKWSKICMAFAIGVLFVMVAILGFSLFQISKQNENAWLTGIGPSLLLPIILIPLLFESYIQKELKKRKKSDS